MQEQKNGCKGGGLAFLKLRWMENSKKELFFGIRKNERRNCRKLCCYVNQITEMKKCEISIAEFTENVKNKEMHCAAMKIKVWKTVWKLCITICKEKYPPGYVKRRRLCKNRLDYQKRSIFPEKRKTQM